MKQANKSAFDDMRNTLLDSDMTDDDVAALSNAIRNSETYTGSYAYTDSQSWGKNESGGGKELEGTDKYSEILLSSCNASYDSATMNYRQENSYTFADSDSGTLYDFDNAVYRLVDEGVATVYRSHKDKLAASRSFKISSTFAMGCNSYTIYSLLPFSYCMKTLQDFLLVVRSCTDISFDMMPECYTCSVSGRGTSKVTYTFCLKDKYTLNTGSIKEKRDIRITTVFYVQDGMIAGFKTWGARSYSLGKLKAKTSSESYGREINITLKYKDRMPAGFKDYSCKHTGHIATA
ncbi:MAG: hypothetical protein LUE27_09025 [Clostridia bacterium]|nr:hypothetical protein [Clostridia bacterium]